MCRTALAAQVALLMLVSCASPGLGGARSRELASHSVVDEARLDSLRGRSALRSGPNCHNATLYLAGDMKHLRHVSSDEFMAALEALNCAALAPGESPRPGDWGLIEYLYAGEAPQLAHSYTLLGEGQVFTKDMFYNVAPFEVKAEASMLRFFGVGVRGAGASRVSYRRCSRDAWDDDEVRLVHEIESFDRELEEFVWSNDEAAVIAPRLREILGRLQAWERARAHRLSEARHATWLRARIQGAKAQIERWVHPDEDD
jgi:hypothetical protein